MSAIHHLLPFRPFAGVHGAQKPTSSYRTGKLPVRKRPNTESWVRYVRADMLSLRLRNFGLPAISRDTIRQAHLHAQFDGPRCDMRLCSCCLSPPPAGFGGGFTIHTMGIPTQASSIGLPFRRGG
jgi:hypothetical protein